MALEIRGLSQRQKVLADILWVCEGLPDVEKFIAGLPTKELKQEASTLVNLMIVHTIDQCYDGMGSMDEAEAVIKRVSKD